MECGVCRQHSVKLYCVNCLREWLRIYNADMKQIQLDRAKQLERVNTILDGPHMRAQQLEAEKYSRTVTIDQLEQANKAFHEEIERDRKLIQIQRQKIQSHRANLQNARALLTSDNAHELSKHRAILHEIKQKHKRVYSETIESKKVLIAELVSLFQLKRIEDTEANILRGSSDDGNDTGSKRRGRVEYSICGLKMPNSRQDFTKFPRDEYNAGIEHVMHMTNQVAYYLGINMPFLMANQGNRSCIMMNRFSVKSGKKKRKSFPLFLPPPPEDKLPHFVIGLAMLNINIVYLCETQNLHIPLEKAINTMDNLLALCRAPGLGTASHSTTFTPQPSQMFSLDINQFIKLIQSRLPPTSLKFSNPGEIDTIAAQINQFLYCDREEKEELIDNMDEVSDWEDVSAPTQDDNVEDDKLEINQGTKGNLNGVWGGGK